MGDIENNVSKSIIDYLGGRRMCFIVGIGFVIFGICYLLGINIAIPLICVGGIFMGLVIWDIITERNKNKPSIEIVKVKDRAKDLTTNGKDYIKSEGMFWEIEINPKGIISIKMVNPLCANETNNEKCMTTINWSCENLCMYCDKCKKCVSNYSNSICWDSARKTLDNKVDMAKNELGIK